MMNAKTRAVMERIKSLEEAIRKAKEYLESGKHAKWERFRPWFGRKADLPPHTDWVKNVFLRRHEKALAVAEKALQRLEDDERLGTRDNHAAQRTGSAAGV